MIVYICDLGETAWLCDFVNLRAEVYENVDNRIPSSVEFGTPEEDAYRRDFTVNSLFYNLQSRKVEDWTNKGVNDMKLKIIRTPLDPNITFRDDPLRLVRPASIYDFINFYLMYFALQTVKSYKVCRAMWLCPRK